MTELTCTLVVRGWEIPIVVRIMEGRTAERLQATEKTKRISAEPYQTGEVNEHTSSENVYEEKVQQCSFLETGPSAGRAHSPKQREGRSCPERTSGSGVRTAECPAYKAYAQILIHLRRMASVR